MSGPLEISLKNELLFIKSLLIPAFNPKHNLDTPQKRDDWLRERGEQKNWTLEILSELIDRYGVVESLDEAKEEKVKIEKAEEDERKQGTLNILLQNQRSSFRVRYVHKTVDVTVAVTIPEKSEDLIRDVKPFIEKALTPDLLPRNYSAFVLEDDAGTIHVKAATIPSDSTLVLRWPEEIVPTSSGSWTDAMLTKLKVNTARLDLDEFCAQFGILQASNQALAPAARSLIANLSALTISTLDDYKVTSREDSVKRRDEALLREPIVKYAYLMNKYTHIEAAVDSFVLRVLIALGFEDGFLVSFPQLRLDLRFGETVRESIADYTIFDVISFFRMVVMEDKNVKEGKKNSVPQMFGQAVAAHATNKPKADQDGPARKAARLTTKPAAEPESEPDTIPMLGVRVNGNHFFFYAITITEQIVAAMDSCTVPTKATVMYRLGDENGLNFLKAEDREVIVRVLSLMQERITFLGAESERQFSS